MGCATSAEDASAEDQYIDQEDGREDIPEEPCIVIERREQLTKNFRSVIANTWSVIRRDRKLLTAMEQACGGDAENFSPSIRVIKQDYPPCWQYLLQCADAAGAYAGQLVALRYSLDAYFKTPENYRAWAATDLAQEHFSAFISSFPLSVSAYLEDEAALTAKELAAGTDAAKAWLTEQGKGGMDLNGLVQWSSFVDQRLNAEVLPAFFAAYKQDENRPKAGVAKIVGHLTVNLFAARGLARGDIEAYGVFECEGTENATAASSSLTGEPRWSEDTKFTYDLHSLDSPMMLSVYDDRADPDADDDPLLGRTVIPTSLVRDDKKMTIRKWFQLDSRRPGDIAGEVYLQMRWRNEAEINEDDFVHKASSLELKLRVDRAKGLPKMDTLGLCDPYCSVRLQVPGNPTGKEEKFKTAKKMNTLQPIWDDHFTFSDVSYDQELCLVCFDYNKTGDTVIGLVTIPLRKLLLGQPFKKWYNIENPKTGAMNLGQVKLELELDACQPPSTERDMDPLQLYNVFPTVKYWLDFAAQVCFNKVRNKGSLMLLRAIKEARFREKVDTEAQLKAALLVQRVWRSRGVWSRVLQYKRRACSGGQFMKYGRAGSPHVRLVYLTEDLQKIAWCTIKDGKRPNKDSHIRVADITDLRVGRTTDVFKSQKSAAAGYYSAELQARVDEERSFSFICGTSRTLDLEADSKLQAEAFLRVMRFVLICKGRISEDVLQHLK
eukprot:TRINITY_DN6620_c0_g1_i1.p1 TRINITY_DN6620_c0_g1~~TRINITY_DN6620_c0_g1_i1.p1  ORF type:complete len:720 (+),score=199.43 TRINITY_DN6620_c0_g1_i1:268-2427(+)